MSSFYIVFPALRDACREVDLVFARTVLPGVKFRDLSVHYNISLNVVIQHIWKLQLQHCSLSDGQ